MKLSKQEILWQRRVTKQWEGHALWFRPDSLFVEVGMPKTTINKDSFETFWKRRLNLRRPWKSREGHGKKSWKIVEFEVLKRVRARKKSMTWSNRDEDLKNTNSLFSATFRRQRRSLILTSPPFFSLDVALITDSCLRWGSRRAQGERLVTYFWVLLYFL